MLPTQEEILGSEISEQGPAFSPNLPVCPVPYSGGTSLVKPALKGSCNFAVAQSILLLVFSRYQRVLLERQSL